MRKTSHDGVGEPGRNVRLRNAAEVAEQLAQLFELGLRGRVAGEHALEAALLVRRCRPVEDGVHQSDSLKPVHGQLWRRSCSISRRRWRASNSRDFTVFSSMSRIRAISP